MSSFVYDSGKEGIADGTILLESHSFKIMLLTASHTPSQSTHTVKTDVSTNEIEAGGGYSAGGAAISGCAVTRSGATVKFDATDVTIESLSPDFRYAVIYDDTHANDALLCLLDPGSLQEPGGFDTRLTFHASGIFTLTDAA